MRKILLVLLFAAALLSTAAKAKAQVIVIANLGVAGDSISKDSLAKIYSGAASRMSSGARVTPIMLRGGPVHSEFLNAYVGKSPIALMVIWRGLVLSGQGAMPKAFDSEADVVKYVAQNSGAIGYIASNTPHDDVKVLQVR
jgi:ABC-type phosphate transport system substrate-binding protein